MPSWRRSAAIARINEHRVYRPLVVTSREREYLDAVGQNRPGINGSVLVSVQSLRPADIRAFLDPDRPWAMGRDPQRP